MLQFDVGIPNFKVGQKIILFRSNIQIFMETGAAVSTMKYAFAKVDEILRFLWKKRNVFQN